MEKIAIDTETIKNFSLDDCPGGNKGYDRVLIQLFGFLGHGKSSFINSCKYVLEDGEFQTYADVRQKDGGNTTARISYPLTDTLTLVDNRGCSVMNSYEKSEFFAQLGNLLPLDKPIVWSKEARDIRNRIIEAEDEMKASDFIFPVFVYSVKNGITPAQKEELEELLERARDLTGIFPIIILTHKKHSNLSDVKSAFEKMGAERIFPLENFTPEDHLKTRGKHEAILTFFIEVIADIKFRVGHIGNPEKAKKERKIIVLDFVHDKEKEEEKMKADLQKQQHERELKIKADLQKQQHERELAREKQRAEEDLKKKDSRNIFERIFNM